MPLISSNFSDLSVTPGAPTSELSQHDPAALPGAHVINTTAQNGVDSYGQEAVSPLTITSDINGASAVQLQNKNTGSLASMDLSFITPTGDYYTGPFLSIGITNDNNNDPLYTIGPVSGYLFTVGYSLEIGTATDGDDVIFHSGGTLTSNERMRINSYGAISQATKVSSLYSANIENEFPGDTGASGTAEIRNWGYLGTFTGATVPVLASATYDLDVTVDGGSNLQLSIALLNSDSWTGIAAKIQTALQTATSSTETVAISSGKVLFTSATTGTSSAITLAAGTAGSGGGDLLAAITALPTTGTIALDSTRSNLFSITPSGNTTLNVATVPVGQRMTFVVNTVGTSSYNITFGTNFKSTGVLATGTSDSKVFTIEFMSDGAYFNELHRTVAM